MWEMVATDVTAMPTWNLHRQIPLKEVIPTISVLIQVY